MKLKKTPKRLLMSAITLGLCGVFLFSEVFAADASKPGSGIIDFATILRVLSELFSRLWIVLANIVGKLMTNSFIYGEALHFDVFLWKIWQLTRNIANFGLGFLFLYEILKYVINPSQTKTPMSMLKDFLKAGVGIQLSWFAIVVVVDVATVLFALVSSFPSQVIGSDAIFSQGLSTVVEASCPEKNTKNTLQPYGNVLCKGRDQIVKFMADGGGSKLKVGKDQEIIKIEAKQGTELSKEQLFDGLLPSPDSLSGPLMFMGFEIFKTAQLSDYSEVSGVTAMEKDFKQIFQILIHSGMIMMYTFSLLVLMVVLIARGVYLWIFIALSPIVVLLKFLLPKAIPSKQAFRDISKMIKLIFQPVYYAMFVSMMMITLVILNWAFKFNMSNTDSPVQISDTQLQMDNNLISISMEGGVMRLYDIFLGFIALFFIRKVMQSAITQETGIGAIDGLTKKVSTLADSFIETTPILPVSGSNSKIGLGAVMRADFVGNQLDTQLEQYSRKSADQTSSLVSKLGFDSDSKLIQSEKDSLSKILSRAEQPETKLKNYISQLSDYHKKYTMYYSDFEADLLKVFGDQAYHPVLERSYGFSAVGIKDIKDATSLHVYLDKNNGWKTLYKQFFDVEKAPTSYTELAADKEKYAIKPSKS